MVYDFTPNIPIQYAVIHHAFQRDRPLFYVHSFLSLQKEKLFSCHDTVLKNNNGTLIWMTKKVFEYD